MKIGIDVTWLKPNKSGGVESFFRNLLDGFLNKKDDNNYVLFVAKDNYESLKIYEKNKKIKIILCNINANDVKKHLMWQNLFFYKLLKKEKIDFCYFPVYEMPIYKSKSIKCVTTIHDIQAIHYPEYFSKLENVWFKFAWKKVIKNSDMVVTISDYTKNDIESHFKCNNNVVRIYNPIELNKNNKDEFKNLSKLYKIKNNEYFYTICSLYKHKNLITLINVMEKIVQNNNINIPNILVISGVGGPQKDELVQIIKEKKLDKNIILTSFVSNDERNCLIENCNIFLFPSIFEGFGMPPIEALMLGSRVITTKCTSLFEVTKGFCEYVSDPFDVDEWILKIENSQKKHKKKYLFEEYNKDVISKQYLDLFSDVYKNK